MIVAGMPASQRRSQWRLRLMPRDHIQPRQGLLVVTSDRVDLYTSTRATSLRDTLRLVARAVAVLYLAPTIHLGTASWPLDLDMSTPTNTLIAWLFPRDEDELARARTLQALLLNAGSDVASPLATAAIHDLPAAPIAILLAARRRRAEPQYRRVKRTADALLAPVSERYYTYHNAPTKENQASLLRAISLFFVLQPPAGRRDAPITY